MRAGSLNEGVTVTNFEGCGAVFLFAFGGVLANR